jgi:hypothetical protein
MPQNVDISKVAPGTPGVCHGSGIPGAVIRTATQSWAGHAVTYIGSGQIIEGTAPCTRIAPAASHDDTVWFYKMWDQLLTDPTGWKVPPIHAPITPAMITKAQLDVVARAHALVGTPYDYMAYMGFGLEVTGLRTGEQLDQVFKQDTWRVCSADVVDEVEYAGLVFSWDLINMKPGYDVNLISPAMLEAYAVIKGWV